MSIGVWGLVKLLASGMEQAALVGTIAITLALAGCSSAPPGTHVDGVVRIDGVQPCVIVGGGWILTPMEIGHLEAQQRDLLRRDDGAEERFFQAERDAMNRHIVYFSRTEVSVEEYLRYCQATGRRVPAQPRFSTPRHPVVNVTNAEAASFCAWRCGRLPTEAEWVCAGRLVEHLAKGGEYDWRDASSRGVGTAEIDVVVHGPVMSNPGDRTPDDLWDLLGSALEWVQGPPYRSPAEGPAPRVMHRAVGLYMEPLRTSPALTYDAEDEERSEGIGFRVCWDSSPERPFRDRR